MNIILGQTNVIFSNGGHTMTIFFILAEIQPHFWKMDKIGFLTNFLKGFMKEIRTFDLSTLEARKTRKTKSTSDICSDSVNMNIFVSSLSDGMMRNRCPHERSRYL